jgi:hypothetical protein
MGNYMVNVFSCLIAALLISGCDISVTSYQKGYKVGVEYARSLGSMRNKGNNSTMEYLNKAHEGFQNLGNIQVEVLSNDNNPEWLAGFRQGVKDEEEKIK